MSPDDLHAVIRTFVDETVLPQVAEWDREDALPGWVLGRLVELGVTGALVPTEYGGRGYGVSDLVPTWRTLSQGWISLTGAVNPTGLATTLLSRHGTEEQRQALAAGHRVRRRAGELLDHRAAGGQRPRPPRDVGRAARRTAGLRLDGEKRWVAGGVTSDVIFMMTQVDGSEKPSCVVLPKAGRGSDRWQVTELDKVGYRGVESAAYVFDDFEAEGAEVLGGEEGLGRRRALHARRARRRPRERRVPRARHHRPLPGLARSRSRRRARSATACSATTRTRRCASASSSPAATRSPRSSTAPPPRSTRGSPERRELSTSAKLVASDTAVWAVDAARRLAASRSYAAGDELARLRRDAPQTQIGEGANDALLMALAKPALAD